MQFRTKQIGKGGRPRKFDEDEVLQRLQHQLWTIGFSSAALDGLARSAGINRPSLAAAFGDKNTIYERAAMQYAVAMNERLSRALDTGDLLSALVSAFDAAIEIYTENGPEGCFVICTAPAEAMTNPVCRRVLDQSIDAIDALFFKRLEKELEGDQPNHDNLMMLAGILGATLHSLALRARAGWGRDQLHHLANGASEYVVAALGRSTNASRDL